MVQYGIILVVSVVAWLILLVLPLPLSKGAKHLISLLSLACSFIWFLLQSFMPIIQLALLLFLLAGLFLFFMDKKMGDFLTTVSATKRQRKDIWEREEDEFVLDEQMGEPVLLDELPTIHKEKQESEPNEVPMEDSVQDDSKWLIVEQKLNRNQLLEDGEWTIDEFRSQPEAQKGELEWESDEQDTIPEMTFLAKHEEVDEFVSTVDVELQPLTFENDIRRHHHDDFFATDGETTKWSEDEWEQLLVDEEDKKQR